MAVGVEKLSGAGLLGVRPRQDAETFEPKGRYGAVAPIDGRIGTETMPGVFAEIGMEYGHRYGGADFELFAQISRRRTTLTFDTLNPLAAYTKRMSLDEIMNDVMIAYPNTRPMCSASCDGAAAAVVVSDAKLKTLSAEQRRQAGEGVGVDPDDRPLGRGLPDPPQREHPHQERRPTGLRAGGSGSRGPRPGGAATASPPPSLVHYDYLMLCEEGGAVDFFNSGATWRRWPRPGQRLGRPRIKGPSIAATGIANVWDVATHLRGEAGPRQIEGARVGLAHVIGLGSACGGPHPGRRPPEHRLSPRRGRPPPIGRAVRCRRGRVG